jgi:hypothetical protein
MRLRLNTHEALDIGASLFLAGQNGVIARKFFSRGKTIFSVTGLLVKERTIYTFPLSLDKHLDPRTSTGKPTLGHFLNHSCMPNALTRIVNDPQDSHIAIIARRDILSGEEIVVDYALMEYEVAAQGTPCQCQTIGCRGYLMGYKDLSIEQKKSYKLEGMVAQYLLELVGT